MFYTESYLYSCSLFYLWITTEKSPSLPLPPNPSPPPNRTFKKNIYISELWAPQEKERNNLMTPAVYVQCCSGFIAFAFGYDI